MTGKRFDLWLAGLLLAVAGTAHAQAIAYELYKLSKDGAQVLVSRGERKYTTEDVVVTESWIGRKFWSKEIPVAEGFSAGASIFPEPDLTGFGLWVKDRGSFMGRLSNGGFSWDWFDRESGDVYRKLQGAGRVRVRFAPNTALQQIASVEVLEDVTLRVDNKPWFFFDRGDTHHLVIRKGSILRFQ